MLASAEVLTRTPGSARTQVNDRISYLDKSKAEIPKPRPAHRSREVPSTQLKRPRFSEPYSRQ